MKNKLDEICEQVAKLCIKAHVDFLFITEGKSRWSITRDKHLMRVAEYHKDTEND